MSGLQGWGAWGGSQSPSFLPQAPELLPRRDRTEVGGAPLCPRLWAGPCRVETRPSPCPRASGEALWVLPAVGDLVSSSDEQAQGFQRVLATPARGIGSSGRDAWLRLLLQALRAQPVEPLVPGGGSVNTGRLSGRRSPCWPWLCPGPGDPLGGCALSSPAAFSSPLSGQLLWTALPHNRVCGWKAGTGPLAGLSAMRALLGRRPLSGGQESVNLEQ